MSLMLSGPGAPKYSACAFQGERGARLACGRVDRVSELDRWRPRLVDAFARCHSDVLASRTRSVFTSTSLPAISSIFCAVLHAERCGPAYAANTATKAIVTTTTGTTTRFIASPFGSLRRRRSAQPRGRARA